jgi:3-dehydroquinate synthase
MSELSIQRNIIFGSLLEDEFTAYLAAFANSKKVILVDENTEKYCLDFLLTNFESLKYAEIVVLAPGEENKILEVCLQVWESMAEYKIGRKDLLINLGGGVITDMGGFIASVYKRGTHFIHIPTTLLAMVDAAIGGKNGVDLGVNKNFLGLFSQPDKIFVDPVFLNTLPESCLIDGMAEMYKHALIASENDWRNIAGLKELGEIKQLAIIQSSVAIKTRIVDQDPTESGLRKKLNFGHTFGHALEGYFFGKTNLSHGSAVGVGMIFESYLSFRLGYLSEKDFKEIERELLRWYVIPSLDEIALNEIIELMLNDKKNFSNKIHFTLLTNIGRAIYDVILDPNELKPIAKEFFIK